MKDFPRILTLAALMLTPVRTADSQTSFYVAPGGKDTDPGTIERPFATLEQARDAIRALKQGGGLPPGAVTVYLRGGTYPVGRTFRLTGEDSGSEHAPIVYRAHMNEEVRLVGALPVTGFTPVTDPAVLQRLDSAAREHICQADLRAQGIADFGRLNPRGFPQPIRPAAMELFFNDRPMTLARWPNGDYAKTGEVLDAGTVKRDGNKAVNTDDQSQCGGLFVFDNQRIERWARADDLWMHGFWCWDWADEYVRVESIDMKRRTVRLSTPHTYGYKADRRFYVRNALEELDQPDEYYVDRGAGTLYFWPPAPIKTGRAVVTVLDEPLVSLHDTAHVTLQQLILECARGDGVVIHGGSDDLVAGCTLRNLGNRAVIIDGGSNNGVQSCDIYQTGEGAVVISGGDRPTLTPAGNFVVNNDIHHFSRLTRTYRPAVRFHGVGQRIAHNRIHDAPHSGIIFSAANDCVIEFNEIFNVCQESEDAGAIYTGRDWTIQGISIRHNFIHHLRGRTHTGRQGIYIDDAAGGMRIFGNVICQVQRAMLIGGGRDNLIENNVIVGCDIGMHIDDRGLNWMHYHVGEGGSMRKLLAALPYQQEPWTGRYPWLVNILEDDPAAPKRNVLRNNVFVRSGRWNVAVSARKHGTIVNNLLTDEDPGFVDIGRMDFRLTDGASAWRELPGFVKIPFGRIGLHLDKYRTALP